MQKLSFILILLCFSSLAYAQNVYEEAKAVANQAMVNIYKHILSEKDKFPELAQFGESNLYESPEGLYAIVYQFSGEGAEKSPFEFGLAAVPMTNTIFADRGAYAFNLEFPFLEWKFAGYIKKSFKRKYNILKVINKEGVLLSDHQQKYMPLQLQLVGNKAVYKPKEPIEFEVELKNASKRHMWVTDLKEDTLYCLFNSLYWGTQSKSTGGNASIILKSGRSLKRTFIGRGVPEPQDVEIYCSYGMSLKGVKPSGVLKVRVAE